MQRAFSTFEQRVMWLLAHPALIIPKPDVRRIVTEMRRDGLVSKLTYWADVKLKKEIRQAQLDYFATATPAKLNAAATQS